MLSITSNQQRGIIQWMISIASVSRTRNTEIGRVLRKESIEYRPFPFKSCDKLFRQVQGISKNADLFENAFTLLFIEETLPNFLWL